MIVTYGMALRTQLVVLTQFATTNASGCDSTATLNLTINNSTSTSASATACDSYTWSANSTTYTT